MALPEFLLLLMTVVVGATGQFFLKAGALKLAVANTGTLLHRVWSIATVPELIAGMLCYGMGAVGLVLLLARVPLSIVGPAIALSYVFSIAGGHFLFNESIPLTRLIGASFIMCGVILVVWKS